MADIPFREDSIVYPRMIKLLACLCEEITASGLPALCRCAVVPGPEAVMDMCGACENGKCGGQAWVRLVDANPSRTFPALDDTSQNCKSPLAFQLELGVARCLPTGTNSPVRGYEPPSVEQLLEATRLQMADMAAMRRAVMCCFGEDDATYLLTTYQPLSVTGDCGGGTWTVYGWEV